MSSAFVPLNPADSTASALQAASDGRVVARADMLATLAARQWRPVSAYTVCDIDFGAGWLFLALWRHWRGASIRPQRLHVVAVVERPYTRDALATVLGRDQSAPASVGSATSPTWLPGSHRDEAVASLLQQWPHVLPGQHRLSFDSGRVTLTLLFGSAKTVLARAGFFADAFLWLAEPVNTSDTTGSRLAALGRHARQGAWCMAGWRGATLDTALRHSAFEPLSAADMPAGFTLARRRPDMPMRVRPAMPVDPGNRQAVVIGAGLAGSNVAHALAQRGWHVSLVGGSSNPHDGHLAAALTPVLARDDNMRARLTRAGALRALAVWRDLGDAIVRRCGTVQLDRDQGRAGELAATLAALQFAPGWVRAVDQPQASRLCGLPVARAGVFFSDGMLVRPDRLIEALASGPGIVRVGGDAVSLRPSGAIWQVLDAQGAVLAEGAQVIVAAARHTPSILAVSDLLAPLPCTAAMHALAGEITLLTAKRGEGGQAQGWAIAPRCVVGGEGYILPAVADQVVVGSTYVRGATCAQLTAAGQRVNLSKMSGLLSAGASDLRAHESDTSSEPRHAGWAGWRAVVAGRLPLIGPLAHAPGVSLATGFGSRGLTWSALAGEMIAGGLEGEPDVLEIDLGHLIAPR